MDRTQNVTNSSEGLSPDQKTALRPPSSKPTLVFHTKASKAVATSQALEPHSILTSYGTCGQRTQRFCFRGCRMGLTTAATPEGCYEAQVNTKHF